MKVLLAILAMATQPCEFEDSENCFWNAEVQGNGMGRSFTNVNGDIHYWDYLE